MNTHRLSAMVMAMTLAGFTHILAAEENISTPPVDDILQQSATAPKPETENTLPETDSQAQTVSPPTENLLSELKVYPSF